MHLFNKKWFIHFCLTTKKLAFSIRFKNENNFIFYFFYLYKATCVQADDTSKKRGLLLFFLSATEGTVQNSSETVHNALGYTDVPDLVIVNLLFLVVNLVKKLYLRELQASKYQDDKILDSHKNMRQYSQLEKRMRDSHKNRRRRVASWRTGCRIAMRTGCSIAIRTTRTVGRIASWRTRCRVAIRRVGR